MFISCISVESTATSFAQELINAPTLSDMAKVEEAIQAYFDTLTPEEQEDFEYAFRNAIRKEIRANLKGAAKELSNSTKAIMDEASGFASIICDEMHKLGIDISKEYSKAIEEISEEVSEESLKIAEEVTEELVQGAAKLAAEFEEEVVQEAVAESAKAVEEFVKEASVELEKVVDEALSEETIKEATKAIEEAAAAISSILE